MTVNEKLFALTVITGYDPIIPEILRSASAAADKPGNDIVVSKGMTWKYRVPCPA